MSIFNSIYAYRYELRWLMLYQPQLVHVFPATNTTIRTYTLHCSYLQHKNKQILFLFLVMRAVILEKNLGIKY